MEYEACEKAIRDHHHQLLFEAEQRGIEIGEQRGIEIGILVTISICRKAGLSEMDISKNIQETYNLSEKTANDFLQKSPQK